LVAPIYITRTLGEATPFPFAPNVYVSFPHRMDWWDRFPGLHRARNGHKRTMDDLQLLYENQRDSHRESVMKRLRHLKRWETGKAVFAALRARRTYSVHIFPMGFVPSIDGSTKRALGITDQLSIPQTQWERAHGIKPAGTRLNYRGIYWADGDTPSAADVFYSEERCEESDADGTLLHELVHALRKISGHDVQTPMRESYPNSEEFYANVIEMIFRSERGQNLFDYVGHPISQASVLRLPRARGLLTALCQTQMSLCVALAQIETDFNPIRPIAEKLFTIDL
jgi:hypothetical protein